MPAENKTIKNPPARGAGRRQPIVRRKLSDQVMERLLELFRHGELRPGDELPSERELMERFGVGRPSVREALQSLANAGLIEIRHGQRTRAAVMTPAAMIASVDLAARYLLNSSAGSLGRLQEARQLFEVGMVGIAARRARRRDLDRLAALLDEQRASLGEHDAYMNADMAFHRAVAAISGNPIFSSLSEAMLGWLREYHVDLASLPGADAVSLREHEAIYRHIAAGDAGRAERAMTRHLRRSSKLYRPFISDGE